MKDGWYRMFSAADEAFIRFLAKFLRDRVTGSFRVVFAPDRNGFGRPRSEDTGRVQFRLPEGVSVAAIAGVRYRHFLLIVETMGYRPMDSDGRDYSSS